MLSRTTRDFRDRLRHLPGDIQALANAAYQLWLDDLEHNSLDFKQVTSDKRVHSVRVGLHWRAVGFRTDNIIVWFWIGFHAKYDKLLKHFK